MIEKVADPPEFTTLASGLLEDYDKLDANKHILNRKKDRLIKSTTIRNKTMLPQQVRVRVKAKAVDDARMSAYIEQENITDLDLFKEVDALKDCCRQCSSDLTTTTTPTSTSSSASQSDTTLKVCSLLKFSNWTKAFFHRSWFLPLCQVRSDIMNFQHLSPLFWRK